MRTLGTILLYCGAVIGVAVVLVMLGIVQIGALPWLVSVALAKLTLLASAGVMAAGAVCLRLDKRASERETLLLADSGPHER